jgi:hypothetical protein
MEAVIKKVDLKAAETKADIDNYPFAKYQSRVIV